MRKKKALYLGVAAVAIAAVWAGSVVRLGAQQHTRGAQRHGARIIPLDSRSRDACAVGDLQT